MKNTCREARLPPTSWRIVDPTERLVDLGIDPAFHSNLPDGERLHAWLCDGLHTASGRSPMSAQTASKVKATIIRLIDELNEAGRSGVKIEFSIETDATLQSKLARFTAYQTMKLDN